MQFVAVTYRSNLSPRVLAHAMESKVFRKQDTRVCFNVRCAGVRCSSGYYDETNKSQYDVNNCTASSCSRNWTKDSKITRRLKQKKPRPSLVKINILQ
jgi:hypothetical protein